MALVCGMGSLAPVATLLLTAVLGGSMDIGAALMLFLLAPVLGFAAVIAATIASVRAKRSGKRLPRRRLPTAVCTGVLGIASFVVLWWLLLLASPGFS